MSEIIKTIEIEIAGVTVKVTPEQAKQLHGALGELLNLPTVKVIEKQVVRDNYYPRPYPSFQPVWYGNKVTVGDYPSADKYRVSFTNGTGTAKLSVN